MVANVNEKAARLAADRFGYKKVTTDWHDVIHDPEVELVIVATPKFTHKVIVMDEPTSAITDREVDSFWRDNFRAD